MKIPVSIGYEYRGPTFYISCNAKKKKTLSRTRNGNIIVFDMESTLYKLTVEAIFGPSPGKYLSAQVF